MNVEDYQDLFNSNVFISAFPRVGVLLRLLSIIYYYSSWKLQNWVKISKLHTEVINFLFRMNYHKGTLLTSKPKNLRLFIHYFMILIRIAVCPVSTLKSTPLVFNITFQTLNLSLRQYLVT